MENAMQIATHTLRLVGPNVSDPRRDGQQDEDNASVYHLKKGTTETRPIRFFGGFVAYGKKMFCFKGEAVFC